jgi:CheY-like chemotaxis protein
MSRVVLIIEDDESCAETLVIALAAVPGLEPRAVASIRAALKAFEQQPNEIAAVVTDLHFPESNGLELIRHLRSEPRYARVQILLVSGDSDPRLPERALSMGANAFFRKPYSLCAVQEKLEQLLS